jgi:hypothetical protein
MATTTLNTRIQLKYDSWTNWEAKKTTFKPLQGEICIVNPGTKTGSVENTPCLIKVGDGQNYFGDLPWLSAVAADVHSWAKVDYATFKTNISNDLKLATNDQIDALSSRVAALEGTVGDADSGLVKAVADNTAAIGAETSARETAINGLDQRLDVIEGADTVEGSVAKALKDAKNYAKGLNDTTNSTVSANSAKLEDITGTVGATITNAVSAETSARETAINGLDQRLDVIEGEGAGSINKALADAKAYTNSKVETINSTTAGLDSRITANETAIGVLNGEGAGSVKKTVDDALNKFATNVTND